MTDELYPSIMSDSEREAHLSELYPTYVRPNRQTPVQQESIQTAPEDGNPIQEIPDETEEQVSEDFFEDFPDSEATPEERKRLEESYSLVDAALAYPRKKRKREIETEEQRISRVLSETLGGSEPQ